MLQTRWQVARLLRRPCICQLRGYADVGPSDPTNPNRGDTETKLAHEPSIGPDISGTPSPHAASAGHYEPRRHTPHLVSENEPIGRGIFIALAVLFGSFAVYKFSRSNSSDPAAAGDVSKQPLITRFLHGFDYLANQNEIRNTLHTQMMEQIGHDRNLFEGSPPNPHIALKAPEVVFNGGSPWNVPAGSTVDLDHVRQHYQKQNVKADIERRERLARMAQLSEGQEETAKVKEAFGETIDAVSRVGKKAVKGD